MHRFVVAVLLWCGWSSVVSGVVSEDALPSQAEWISAGAGDATSGTTYFRRAFVLGSAPVKAILMAAADQRATIFVDGVLVAEVRGYQTAGTADITRHLTAGSHVLAAKVEHLPGQGALRLLVELAPSDGKQRWIVSDSSWLASHREAADWNRSAQADREWKAALGRGGGGLSRWGNPFSATKSVDAYNSWMLARGAGEATPPETMVALPGYRVERLRSARDDEGSWVSLAFDPRGRLTVAREKQGLLRMTLGSNSVERVEVIEDTLLECRGLLYAHGALYVNANNSKGFYRLRDTDNDDLFDEKKLLLQTEGGVGHGRNQLALGPDGLIYLAHGDDVALPSNVPDDSPMLQMGDDQLMPSRNHPGSIRNRRYARVGHVLQTDRDGSFFKLYAGGLRNPMDVAFNEDGELFTFDADMERDIGAPWYQPNRVLHLVPGSDFGWRRSLPNLPPHTPDVWTAAVNIGVASPTGVAFGRGTQYPPKQRRALFVADWAYGRILAVNLRPDGSTYRGEFETFLSGRPLNVTDIVFGDDGMLYFVTGGRGTKSGLYRVRWTETDSTPGIKEVDSLEAREARALRRRLESIPGAKADTAADEIQKRLEVIWPHLGHSDRWIRSAARLALERQTPTVWRNRAANDTNLVVGMNALLALARNSGSNTHPALLSRLTFPAWTDWDEWSQLTALRILALSFSRIGWPGDAVASRCIARVESIYPSPRRAVNFEAARVLSYLRSTNFLAKTLPLLAAARASEDLGHYLFQLTTVTNGWSVPQRTIYFEALRRAETEQGARDYYSVVAAIRREAVRQLSPVERGALGALLSATTASAVTVPSVASALPLVKEWGLADFDLEKPRTSSPAAGRAAYVLAGCGHCHRFGSEGGVMGPDLTAVASRFPRRDLLDAILNPSKVIDEKFRGTVLTLVDGTVVSGTIEVEDENGLTLLTGDEDGEPRTFGKERIATRKYSEESPMPSGLLNVLTREQILDLLAYLEGGAPVHTARP